MKISRRLRAGAAKLPFLAIAPSFVLALAGCSSERSADDPIATTSAPIIGGVADTTDTWVVGIDIGGYGLCSGTLIAPNLVLTARHCVSKTPEALDCRPDAGLTTNKILGNYPASSFRVSTAQDFRKGPSWSVAAVRYIDDPKANQLCGYDLALLELKKGTSGYPTKWMAPSNVAPLKHSYIALGYGCQNPETLSGGGCDPRGYRMRLDPVFMAEIDPQEFIISGRVCGGDSGGPVWNSTLNVVYGALSRGDATTADGPGCNFGIYTRTDAHWAWLQKYGKAAAKNGGYAPLPWMSEPLPEPDAGPVDSGPPPPPPKDPLGSDCVTPAECESDLCVDFGGDKVCSEACSDTTPCPSGFTCNGGYCYPDSKLPPPVDAGGVEDDAGSTPAADDQGTVKASTCAYGPATPPPRPQPWIVGALAAVAVAIVRRRR